MSRLCEPSGRKKGVSGLIAAIFLFAMIFSSGAAYFAIVQYNQHSQLKVARQMASLEIEQSLENFLVTGNLFGGNIGVRINNTGSVTVRVVGIFVMDADGNIYTAINSASDSPLIVANVGAVSPAGSENPYDTAVAYSGDTQYVIKVVSSRGNTKVGFYPPLYDISYLLATVATVSKGVGSLVLNLPAFGFRYYFASDYPLGLANQSGFRVGGYPAFAVTKTTELIFSVDLYNGDPDRRDIELNYLSLLSLGGAPSSNRYYLIKSVAFTENGYSITSLSRNEYITLPYQGTVTLYFSPASQGGSTAGSSPSQGPFGAFLLLYGHYADKRPYAQTIPMMATYVTEGAKITGLLPSSGGSATTVTVDGIGFTGSLPSGSVTVGWMNTDGTITTVGNGGTTSAGALSSTTFTPPSDFSEGYYCILVTDGISTAFVTFHHTGT